MKRRPRTEPEAIEAVLERSGEDRFAHWRPPIAHAVWRAAVGPRIADRAKPQSLENGVLTVKVATAPWAHELSLLSEALRERLRAHGVAVESLRFRVGPIESAPRPPERRQTRAVPPPAPLPPELARALKDVEDDELRDTIAHAARANLAWQRNIGRK